MTALWGTSVRLVSRFVYGQSVSCMAIIHEHVQTHITILGFCNLRRDCCACVKSTPIGLTFAESRTRHFNRCSCGLMPLRLRLYQPDVLCALYDKSPANDGFLVGGFKHVNGVKTPKMPANRRVFDCGCNVSPFVINARRAMKNTVANVSRGRGDHI